MLFSPPRDASWIEILPDGHQGTIRTLEAMRFLCRKDYKSPFVEACVWGIQEFGRQRGWSDVDALFFFARDSIRYVEDPPGLEKVADFERTTQSLAGDCDDKCVWLATALLSIDVPVRFVIQSYGRTWDHVYLEYYDWSRLGWVALDPTADGHTGFTGRPGWRQPLASSGYEMRFDV
jgi:hypothetical protein